MGTPIVWHSYNGTIDKSYFFFNLEDSEIDRYIFVHPHIPHNCTLHVTKIFECLKMLPLTNTRAAIITYHCYYW